MTAHQFVSNLKNTSKPVLYGKMGIISNPLGFVAWSFLLGAGTILFGKVLLGAAEMMWDEDENEVQ